MLLKHDKELNYSVSTLIWGGKQEALVQDFNSCDIITPWASCRTPDKIVLIRQEAK